ncbi:MAG: Bax inhibitor-1 family protein [Pirellulales bacterium]|nr:Bax inhibitor-1 family protein [Pirellulales bacterium]OUT68115.1 MAG: permease [Planctomycetaceae bacterium TMED10]
MNSEDAFLQPIPVAQASADVRSRFIVRTYNHLFGAIALFTLIEIALFKSGVAERIASALMGNWLLVLGGFMLVGWFSSRAAANSKSLGSQYLALVAFVAAEAIIFIPLLFVANAYSQQTDGSNVIASAAGTTILGCAGLTVVAFVTRKDFSFLRSFLMWGGIVALLLIVASMLFGFQMGTWFSVAMIGFAGAAVLYDTSNVLHHYEEDRYVAASLQLFSSVALMFYYVLMLFTSRR